MPTVRQFLHALGLSLFSIVCTYQDGNGALAQETPRSNYIADVVIDMKTLRKFADESDNFPLTWHSNGALYGAWSDGWGFVQTDVTKRAIGVSRISGAPTNLGGRDVWEGAAQGGACCWSEWNGKSWGMLSTGADLHMWFTQGRPRLLGFTEAKLATSSDGGRSWRKAEWAFTAADGVLMPSFLQAGQGYASPDLPAEVMDYVYSYHSRLVATPGHVQTPGAIDLFRVPKDRMADRLAYQFYAGTDGDGAPVWSTEIDQSQPILTKAHALDAPPTVAWNPYLQRFIMVMPHVPPADPAGRGLAFYEAGSPWGPWFEIKTLDTFAGNAAFYFQMPAKWQRPDWTAWLAFSGIDVPGGQEWDSLNTVKVRFIMAPPK